MDRSLVKWLPLISPFLKLNFDGTLRGNLGDSGIGVAIRNHQGVVVSLKVAPIPYGSNNLAKASALLEGLVLAKKLAITSLHVEGDSSVIINACISRQIVN